jgi:hypothetical protein
VGDRGRAGDDLGAGQHPGVTLRIRALRDDGQVDAVRADLGKGAQEAVDVSADTTPVGGDAGGVDEDSGRTTGGHVATPLGLWARPLARVRRSMSPVVTATPLDITRLRRRGPVAPRRDRTVTLSQRTIVRTDD